jgi:hypothetical protein
MSEVTKPPKATLGSPMNADASAADYSNLDPRIAQAFQQNPGMDQVVQQIMQMAQQGNLQPGFNMSISPGGMQPGGAPMQPGGSGMPTMPPNPMMPQQQGMMPQMGGMQGMPGMGGMPVNPVQPVPSIGAQMFGNPMSSAPSMNAADAGMHPGSAMGFRDMLGAFGNMLMADPGAMFRGVGAMATGSPQYVGAWAQREHENREKAALMQEQMASREDIARENAAARRDTQNERMQTRQDYQDQLFIDRANNSAAKAGVNRTATNRAEAEELLREIGVQNEQNAIDKLTDSSLDDELRGIQRMPARLAQYFKSHPAEHAAYQEEAGRLREWFGDWDSRRKDAMEAVNKLRKAITERTKNNTESVPFFIRQQIQSLYSRLNQLDVWKTKQNRALDWGHTIDAVEDEMDEITEKISDLQSSWQSYEGATGAGTGAPGPSPTAPPAAGKSTQGHKSRLEELINGATGGGVEFE